MLPRRAAVLRGLTLLGIGLGGTSCADILDAVREPPVSVLGAGVSPDDAPWTFPGATPQDAAGGLRWSSSLSTLASDLAPLQPWLQPWYRPTLFAALASEAGSLRDEIKPIDNEEMCRAYARGVHIRELFERENASTETALVVDAPGVEAVAVAAALAPRFDPVFTFDNYPHPREVVPSRLTLAAALYYTPVFIDARAQRPLPAPPVFVLDSHRLDPYVDAAGDFDNRYMVALPTADALARMNVRQVLYVAGQGRTQELDDLNQRLVEIAAAGIDVKLLALDDLVPPEAVADACGASPRYYLGGNVEVDLGFWRWFHWSPSVRALPGGPAAPAWLGPRCGFVPRPRPVFSSSRPPTPGSRPGGTPGPGQSWSPHRSSASSSSSWFGFRSSGRSGSIGRSRSSHTS